MEEGEILDEEGGLGGGIDGVAKKKAESDAESGEIEPVGVRDQSDKRNLVCSESPYVLIIIIIILFFFFEFSCLLSFWPLRKFVKIIMSLGTDF